MFIRLTTNHQTIEEATNLLLELGEGAKIMAGGTDIIPPMRDKVIAPEYLIDIKDLPGMDYLEYDENEGLKIGALTKLRTLEFSDLVKKVKIDSKIPLWDSADSGARRRRIKRIK